MFVGPSRDKDFIAGASVLCGLVVLAIWMANLEKSQVIPDFGPLPELAEIEDVAELKATFFDYLTPIVRYENGRILEERAFVQSMLPKIEAGGSLNNRELGQLQDLFGKYELDWNTVDLDQAVHQLLLRVDVIPRELALVQAAKESGWGRSRFSEEANNLFGQWCYSPGCGVVPNQRAQGDIHEVQSFESVSDAIASYMRNLNSHDPYETLRLMRAGMRQAEVDLDGYRLAEGLLYYSQRREAYVEEVQAMILQYRSFLRSRENATAQSMP